MKNSIARLSLLLGFTLSLPLLGFGIDSTKDMHTLHALRAFKQEFTQITNVSGFELNTQIEFLPPEHELEAETFFVHKWHENEQMLNSFADLIGQNGQGFRYKTGFVAISIGSLNTHLYYMDGPEKRSFLYPFGVKSSLDERNIFLQALLDHVKRLNRPSIYFNAVSYAQILGYTPTGPSYIDLNEEVSFEKGELVVSAGRMAEALSREIRSRKIEGAFIHQTSKHLKLSYGWTTALVKNMPKLSDGNNIVGDFSNSSFSAKLVIDQRVQSENLVKDDKYSDSESIVKHYTNTPTTNTYHSFKTYMDRILKDVKDAIAKNPQIFAGQEKIWFVMGITGKLSELWHRAIATENSRVMPQENPFRENPEQKHFAAEPSAPYFHQLKPEEPVIFNPIDENFRSNFYQPHQLGIHPILESSEAKSSRDFAQPVQSQPIPQYQPFVSVVPVKKPEGFFWRVLKAIFNQ